MERKRHWRHGITGAGFIEKDDSGLFLCPHCGLGFKSRNGLGQHISYKHHKIRISSFSISPPWNKDQKIGFRKETLEKLHNGELNPVNSKRVIKRFLVERDGEKCSTCGLETWLGNTIIFDIDHIDGNRNNNLPENWRLLCPNCHRQTPTWGNKKSQWTTS
jgi:hypothetical protein